MSGSHGIPLPTPQPEDEAFDLKSVRARLHNQNDTIQRHEGLLIDHSVRMEMAEKQILVLNTKAATREQLDAAVLALGEKVAAAVTLMTLQIKTIADDIAPIKSGIYWVVGLVLSAVILAALAFLFRRPV